MASAHAQFHHILVPTDGSQPSINAGQFAVTWAAADKASITFVYVVDNIVARELAGVFRGTGTLQQEAAQAQQQLELSGQRYLDYLCRMASEAGVTWECVMRHGVPYEEIATLARERGVDLIVIGQVGSRGSQHIRIGSVAERVIEGAPCAVLVVK